MAKRGIPLLILTAFAVCICAACGCSSGAAKSSLQVDDPAAADREVDCDRALLKLDSAIEARRAIAAPDDPILVEAAALRDTAADLYLTSNCALALELIGEALSILESG